MAIDNGRADWTGTEWHKKDIPAMWATVAHHTPDAYTPHLAGWRRTTELLSEHVSRMRAYRTNLALAWPPTRSPAAAVYLARFDTDIANAQATLEASIANYAAYAAAMQIVSEAQTKLRPIFEEYTAHAAANAARSEMVSASGGRAAAGAFITAPEANGRLADLTSMARATMYRASQELIEATAALQIAPPYEFLSPRDDMSPKAPISTPNIPPVIPLRASDESSPRGLNNARMDLTQQSERITHPVGPTLTTSGSTDSSSASDIQPDKTARNLNPDASSSGVSVSDPRSHRAETIIGSPHAKDPTGARPNRATSPGKIIGHPETASRESMITPPIAPLGGRTSTLESKASHENNESDNCWELDEGVPPVLLPNVSFRIADPGPAIGLTS